MGPYTTSLHRRKVKKNDMSRTAYQKLKEIINQEDSYKDQSPEPIIIYLREGKSTIAEWMNLNDFISYRW